jgi:hypothetical protein
MGYLKKEGKGKERWTLKKKKKREMKGKMD